MGGNVSIVKVGSTAEEQDVLLQAIGQGKVTGMTTMNPNQPPTAIVSKPAESSDNLGGSFIFSKKGL